MAAARPTALHQLAEAHGVRPTADTPPDTLVAVLAAMDVDAATEEAAARALDQLRRRQHTRLLPRCLVQRHGHPLSVDVPNPAELWVELESGGTRTVSVPFPRAVGGGRSLPADLPLGYHTLCVRLGAEAATAAPLIVAPDRLGGPQQRGWGYLAQLYSVLSERSWGMGDLGDLAELVQWAGGAGADFVQVNPLHAGMPAAPGGHSDPSPYRPSSRRFADPLYLRVENVPEFAYLDPSTREHLARTAAKGAGLRDAVLRHDALIDRDAVWALKREALELLHTVPRGPGRASAYAAYRRREGERLEGFAVWNALAEAHGPDWRAWPPGLRDPGSAAVARAAAELAPRVEFHRWLAWVTDEQVAAAQTLARASGMAVGVVHDLAVGCHPEGADAWALQSVLASGISVGAPPDAFNAHGQDWGLPPWRPDSLAAGGYAAYADLIRAELRNAGALRVDHVMGLFRLWWVPEGRQPTEGVYVHYDHEAMLGVLALEAHRAGAFVIGEDLGTVEPGVREELAARGILGTSVLWFERDYADQAGDGGAVPLPAERWRADCVATLTTHDLPSTAARLSGEHVELRHRLGLLDRPLAEAQADDEAETEEWLGELAREGLLAPASPFGEGPAFDPADPTAELVALHRYLARTPARLVGVWLPDTVGDPRPQNLPGTSTEYPNWRLPVADSEGHPLTLEQLAASPGPGRLAEILNGEL